MMLYRGLCWMCCGSLVAGAILISGRAGVPGGLRHHEERHGLRSQGTPDKDNTLVYIWDGLKRVVVRDSKVEKIDAGQRLPDRRAVPVRPADGGARRLDAQEADQRGGRPVGRPRAGGVPLPRLAEPNRPVSMEQAIIEIGPHIVRYRGIDGFWLGVVETNQVPRPVGDGAAGAGRPEERRASASASSAS